MLETGSLPSIPAIAAALREVFPDEADAVADLENLVRRATTGKSATAQVQPGVLLPFVISGSACLLYAHLALRAGCYALPRSTRDFLRKAAGVRLRRARLW